MSARSIFKPHSQPNHNTGVHRLTFRRTHGIIKNTQKPHKKIKKREARGLTIQDFKEATAKYAEIKNRIQLVISTINPVEMVTPNLEEVKETWIENAKNGVFLNPKFHYNYTLLIREAQKIPMLELLKSDLAEIPPTANPAEVFVYHHLMSVVDDTLYTLKAAEAMVRGDDTTTARYFLAKYGQPDIHTYWMAMNIAGHGVKTKHQKSTKISPESIKLLEDTVLDAQFIKEMFIWAMEQYDTPWPVEILSDCSAIDVRDRNSLGSPMIAIPADRRVSGLKLIELIGHEIESHWLGSKNAEKIGTLKVDSELIYEGAAKLKDYQFGASFLGEATMPQPYYIIAERQALLGYSFAEVGKNLIELYGISAKRAWGFTYRTFRGITDATNKSGYAFTKDRAYLEGFIIAQQIQDKNPALLSFNTLKSKDLAALEAIIDPADLATMALKDKKIQEESAREILRRIKK